MKTFKSLQEERGEKAYKQAISMGLKYGGFGYWKDPQTNETVYKTENDTLVPVEPREESELASKGSREGGDGRPDPMQGGMGAGGGGMMGAGGMLQMPGGMGTAGQGIQGAPEPGKEQVEKDGSWDPGPDGDTCVGPESEDPGKVPEDSFVGRTNFLKWKSGPDGDNINTVSLSMVREQIIQLQEEESSTGSVPKTSTWGMEDYSDDIGGRRLADIQRSAGPAAKKKDASVVNQMNAHAKTLSTQPDYKMDQFDSDRSGSDYVAGGAFGKTFKDRNGNIVKQGRIGPGELAALHAMQKNNAFPTLINAQFDSPFIHESSAYNNPLGGSARSREVEYWDPDEQSEFHRQFPTAYGTYAMTAAEGMPLHEAMFEMGDEAKEKMMRNFWRARGDLHKAGFSHNDMHGGNIMTNPETGEVSIIDLGLAKENRLSALMEALGGLDFEEGQDYQLAHQVAGSNLPERIRDFALENRDDIEQTLFDSLDPEMGMESEEFGNADSAIQELLRGDIRMREKDFDRIKEQLPSLGDDKFVENLINMLYNEIGNSELADRMSDAFTERQKDSKVIRAADKVRQARGEKPINVTNRDVIPPRNMDFDD